MQLVTREMISVPESLPKERSCLIASSPETHIQVSFELRSGVPREALTFTISTSYYDTHLVPPVIIFPGTRLVWDEAM